MNTHLLSPEHVRPRRLNLHCHALLITWVTIFRHKSAPRLQLLSSTDWNTLYIPGAFCRHQCIFLWFQSSLPCCQLRASTRANMFVSVIVFNWLRHFAQLAQFLCQSVVIGMELRSRGISAIDINGPCHTLKWESWLLATGWRFGVCDS